MSGNDDIIKTIKNLVHDGQHVFFAELKEHAPDLYNRDVKHNINEKDLPKLTSLEYQKWYTKCLPLIRKIAPERYQNFVDLYEPDTKRKDITWLNYTIKDYFLGLRVKVYGKNSIDTISAFSSKIQQQINILHSAIEVADRRLYDIESILQSSLFDNELNSAEDLMKKNHLRAAGAVAGVVLENHLKTICKNREISIKKTASISDYNDALKNVEIIDLINWRHIQRLGDIRNLCVHSKGREPTKEEILDLIVGTKSIISKVF